MKRYRLVCAACNETIGQGTEEEAEEVTLAHAEYCTATAEEHERALYDMRFRNIVQGLNL